MTDPSRPDAGAEFRPADGEFEVRLLDYWRVLVQRRLVVLGCLAAVVVVTMTLTLLTAPTYRATATLEIQRNTPEVVEFADVLNVDPDAYWDFHQTQQKILESRSVARIAAERLDLVHRPEFAARKGSPLGRLRRWVGGWFREEEGESQNARGAYSPEDRATDYVQGGLDVALIRNSYLSTVSFEDRDPRLAAEVANAVADAYQQFQLDSRYNTTGQAKEFLTKDVARVRAEIGVLEQQLQAYGIEKEILALSDGTQDISEQALGDINRRCTEASARMASAEAVHQAVQQAPPEALPEVLASPIIGRLRERHAELEREHATMSERFKPGWPALDQLAEELAQARAQLGAEAETIARHVRAAAEGELAVARAEYAALERRRETQKREVQRVNEDAIDYASLKSEIETKRKVLTDLVERQSETETSYRLREAGTSNVRVVDRAEVPTYPARPNKRLNLMLSLALGLGLGVGLALFVDHLDNTIKTEQDIQRVSGLTVLGHVPLTRSLAVVGEEAGATTTRQLDMASHLEPRSHFSETFRNLRTSLLLATPDHPPRHVLVTSCEPGDGKSTVALNLAIVLTQQGRKVLLVDADLRRPRLHKTVGLDNAVGLSSYLSGNAAIADLAHETEIPGLRVITSGPIPPNPSELLGSPRLDALLDDYLKANGFDHLIVDSPPLLSVADSIVLSTRTDSTVVVVRAGSTRRESLTQSVVRLRQSRANVVGAVLNAVAEEKGYYYRYYRHKRYYGKGEEAPVVAGQTDTRADRRQVS
jgi:capsular exopolysaccharide synthesis family protein